MGWVDNMLTKLADRITVGLRQSPQAEIILNQRSYRMGKHRAQLKRSREGYDDNVALNFCGLIVNRAVSQTIGDGIEYKVEGDDGAGESQNAAYLDAALDANKQEVLFHRSLLFSCESGTGYWMLVPESMADVNGGIYPRIVVLDPLYMTIHTRFGDAEVVSSYVYEYSDADPVTGKEVAFRKVVARDFNTVQETWTITDYINTGGSWQPVAPPVLWPWDFAPILHWQNSPSTSGVYGEPDITDDLIALQDKINFSSLRSNSRHHFP